MRQLMTHLNQSLDKHMEHTERSSVRKRHRYTDDRDEREMVFELRDIVEQLGRDLELNPRRCVNTVGSTRINGLAASFVRSFVRSFLPSFVRHQSFSRFSQHMCM